MPKVKKLKRKKKFRVNVNRKRLRNKLRKLPSIECKEIKKAWSIKQSTITNLSQMGLAYDANEPFKVPHVKDEMLTKLKNSDENIDSDNIEKSIPKKKLRVAQSLEQDAKAPRARLFRLPNNEVRFATYMLEKYGEDYQAMVKDSKNYNQLTWRQIKRKIDKFKSIPEQYAEYLVKIGEIVLEDPTPLKKIKPSFEKPELKRKSEQLKKKRKKTKCIKSIWQEEIVDNEFNNVLSNKSTDNGEDKTVSTNQLSQETKLQLFPDDEYDNVCNITENDVSSSESDSSYSLE